MSKLTHYFLATLCAAALPLSAQTLQQTADGMNIKDLKISNNTLQLPVIPGAEVSIFSTDYQHVIDKKGHVTPLAQTVPVHVSFVIKKGEESVISKDYVVTVPGTTVGSKEKVNGKPATIPEILSWKGSTGHYELPETIKVDGSQPFAAAFAKELEELLGRKVEVVSDPAEAHIKFIKKDINGGEEAYELSIAADKGVSLTADGEKGLFWGTRTVLQIAKLYGSKLPCGEAQDAPRFGLRGFMLDVGRLPIPLDYVRELVHTMAWYKMNDLHIHLNDNLIFHEDYVDAGKNPTKESYTAFRLESKVVGKDGTPLTAQDVYYTKQEFADLIAYAKKMNVNIVPEFDTPGHALSFTKVRPDLVYQGEMTYKEKRRCEMLDASNPETLKFVGSVFDEYLLPQDGKKPVFDGCVVHVGADEFFGETEHYRQYADGLLKHVLSRGYTPRIWGSLNIKKGNTPVIGEGVQMNLWNSDWARAWDSINQGFDVINTNDGALYIVPEAKYYRMDMNQEWVYQSWLPNEIGWAPNKEIIPAGHPKLLGATYAIWNDMIDLHHNGYGSFDLRKTIADCTRVVAQKMWGKHINPYSFTRLNRIGQALSDVPGINPDFRKKAAHQGFDLQPVSLPVQMNKGALGPMYHMTMELEMTEAPKAGETQILLESPQGKLYAALEDGTVGFVRNDSIGFSYATTLPVGKKVKLELIGKERVTELWLDGKKVGTIELLNKHRTNSEKLVGNPHLMTNDIVSTFVLPLDVLGSTFKGKIHSFSVRPL